MKSSRAVDYYNKFSQEDLLEMDRVVRANPENKNPAGSFHIYKPSVEKRLDDIARAINWKIAGRKLKDWEEAEVAIKARRDELRNFDDRYDLVTLYSTLSPAVTINELAVLSTPALIYKILALEFGNGVPESHGIYPYG